MFWGGALLAAQQNIEEELQIEADEVTGTIGQQTIASGTVQLVQGKVQLQADSMIIDWDEGEIALITAIGDQVQLEKKAIHTGSPVVAHADKVIFYRNEKRLVLTGNANLRQNGNLFTGEEIHYDLTSEEFRAAAKTGDRNRVEIIWDASSEIGKD